MMDNPPPTQPPRSQSPLQISPEWLESSPIRREYREERENEMSALLDSHQAAERAAIDFAQTVIRSGFVINAGAIIAIPAIVALFNLDAEALRNRLMVTGIFFGCGILAAWGAGVFAFFALAHKSDQFLALAAQTARVIQGKYFPRQAAQTREQAGNAERRAARLRRFWVVERYVGIVLSIVSIGLFLCGSWVGIHAVMRAPHKLPSTTQIAPTRAVPKR